MSHLQDAYEASRYKHMSSAERSRLTGSVVSDSNVSFNIGLYSINGKEYPILYRFVSTYELPPVPSLMASPQGNGGYVAIFHGPIFRHKWNDWTFARPCAFYRKLKPVKGRGRMPTIAQGPIYRIGDPKPYYVPVTDWSKEPLPEPAEMLPYRALESLILKLTKLPRPVWPLFSPIHRPPLLP